MPRSTAMAQVPFSELDRIPLDRLAQEIARRWGLDPGSGQAILGEYIRYWCGRETEAPLVWHLKPGWPPCERISLAKACTVTGRRTPGSVAEIPRLQIFQKFNGYLFFDRQGVEKIFEELGLATALDLRGLSEALMKEVFGDAPRSPPPPREQCRLGNEPFYDAFMLGFGAVAPTKPVPTSPGKQRRSVSRSFNDERTLDEMANLLKEGEVTSIKAAACRVAPKAKGASLEATVERLARKYRDRPDNSTTADNS